MIVVNGATGKYGRQVVDGLLEVLPADRIGVNTRDPGKTEDLKQRGVRVCCGNFEEPATLREAFDGAEQVLIVSVTTIGAEGFASEIATRAAKDAGARARSLRVIRAGERTPFLFRRSKITYRPTPY